MFLILVLNLFTKDSTQRHLHHLYHPQGTKILRNGVRYKLNVVTQDGTEAEDFIHVIVVDSDSNEVCRLFYS